MPVLAPPAASAPALLARATQYEKTPLDIANGRERHGVVSIIERAKKRRKEEKEAATRASRQAAAR